MKKNKVDLKHFLNNINANHFLKEFSFSKNQFYPRPSEEKEFADHVILIDKLLIVFQFKDRNKTKNLSSQTEKNWFYNKVLKKSKEQIKDTIKYFVENEHIEITNQRSHKFDIKSKYINKIVKIILYLPSDKLPPECYEIKSYISQIAGFIHVLSIYDYLNICNTFITPIEIAQYFDFREWKITNFPKWKDERSLAGQFISGRFHNVPDKKYILYLKKLNNDVEDFDIFPIFKDFEESIEYSIGQIDDNDYYLILEEFAKLNRAELREVKKRIIKCIENCKIQKFAKPYRMMSIQTNCGFIFIPFKNIFKNRRIKSLKNLTYASKYFFKSPKHIGVSFVLDENIFFVDWCYIESEWIYDSDLEKELSENFLFRKTSAKLGEYYKFREKI